MKLAAVLILLVALPTLARADARSGPPGMYQLAAQPPPRPRRAELRQVILQRFDHNHDGRLEPRERRQAARALRRLARTLDRRPPGVAMRGRAGIIQRYDLNGDGNVGPSEMPPAMAKRLRRFDRNGDGWLDDADRQ